VHRANRVLSALLATSLIGPSLLFAQSESQPQRGPDGRTVTVVPGIQVLPLPGRPFSAINTVVWTRTLDGGGTVTTYQTEKIMRDSQGRIYLGDPHIGPDQNFDPQTPQRGFTLYDPVARTMILCQTISRRCFHVAFHPPPEMPLQPVGQFDNGRRLLTRDSLGNRMIQDLPVVGTLEKIAIQPGTIGNDTTITLSKEFWYSPDLQTNLSVIRKDPTQGTQTITLDNLSRSEPDPSAFIVPSNYTILGPHPAPPTN
jgi:hypothetical protein